MAGNEVPSPATFLLTRNAALDLRRIYTLSRREWGDDVADRYLADLYAAMGIAAANPEKGRLRQYRSAPFPDDSSAAALRNLTSCRTASRC
ncbi:MAG: type II toxin-antitoxin system RelE/ParE family toxin [Burkholderiales bacterium]|nr:type II toxin-antitoxin system RelE/ParE family toxin [Burkholderiales bacterium]